jgi:hypothetical protein
MTDDDVTESEKPSPTHRLASLHRVPPPPSSPLCANGGWDERPDE